jgi:DNA-binding transcriptional ArsR family regulator
MDIQEIVSRGKFIFSGAPKRLEVFKLVNGKKSAKEIAKKVGKSVANTLGDLQKMRDIGLIKERTNHQGNSYRKENSIVYEKDSLTKHIPISFFTDPIQAPKIKTKLKKNRKKERITKITIPDEKQILSICGSGEDQQNEFKAPGVEPTKITKEISAILNTKLGGIVFYGIEDDGTILGSDKRRQTLDQSIQNSIKNSIAPAPPLIRLLEKSVLGQLIILIVVPPWNRKEVYQYQGKVLIRKSTNIFGVTPEELKKLHQGKYVV